MGDALKSNSSLLILGLCGCSIRSQGARLIFDALKTNSTLTELALLRNDISLAAVAVLSNVLETNYSLTKLDLAIPCKSLYSKVKSSLQANKGRN